MLLFTKRPISYIFCVLTALSNVWFWPAVVLCLLSSFLKSVLISLPKKKKSRFRFLHYLHT